MKIFNKSMRVRTLRKKLKHEGIQHTVYETQTDFLGWIAGVGAIILTGMVISLCLMGTRLVFNF